jgi:hypothetical protein
MIEINIGWVFLQLLLAFIVLLILYITTLVVMRIDSLVIEPSFRVKQREEAIIVDKQTTSASLSKTKFNTIFPFKNDFLKIPSSANGTTGTQYTYQFWMKVDNTNEKAFQDLVILLKGDTRKYGANFYDPKTLKLIPYLKQNPDYFTKCPLIKFTDSYKNLVVEFNTTKHPNVRVPISLDGIDPQQSRKNLLTLLPLEWFLFTFVFEDNYSVRDGIENGIRFTFYLNNIPVIITTGSTDVMLMDNSLRLNDGDLYLFPNYNSDDNLMMVAGMKYFNYAKTDSDIRSDFSRGMKTFKVGNTQNLYSSIE